MVLEDIWKEPIAGSFTEVLEKDMKVLIGAVLGLFEVIRLLQYVF